MAKKIINIDVDKCVGCGLCVKACQEDVIGIVDGKARLLRQDYCDGLGNCLPVCPTKAISFKDGGQASTNKSMLERKERSDDLACACPGTHSKAISRKETSSQGVDDIRSVKSQLNQWPLQIKLVPANAAYFNDSQLLIAADCTAYAYGNFHSEFMKNKITLIGCPKLDQGDYSDKLTAILESNNIKSLTVVKMQVPCCNGIESAVRTALKNSGKLIPWQVVTISTSGEIIEL